MFGIKRFICFILALLMLSCCTAMNIFAAPKEQGTVSITIPSSDSAAVEAFMTTLKVKDSDEGKYDISLDSKSGGVDATSTGICSSDTKGIKFNKQAFSEASSKKRKKAVKNFVDALKESDISTETQQLIFDEMSEADSTVASLMIPLVFDNTKADVFTAYKWMAPFLNALRVVFGVAAIIIIILVVISTIVDLVTMGLPYNRDNKDGKRPMWLSPEAYSTIKETESSLDSNGGYKNAYGIYFKRRSVTYIILSFCVLFLVMGQISTIISFFMSLGSGIVN